MTGNEKAFLFSLLQTSPFFGFPWRDTVASWQDLGHKCRVSVCCIHCSKIWVGKYSPWGCHNWEVRAHVLHVRFTPSLLGICAHAWTACPDGAHTPLQRRSYAVESFGHFPVLVDDNITSGRESFVPDSVPVPWHMSFLLNIATTPQDVHL